MLRIEIQSENGKAILYCSGRIVFGMEVETLRTIARSRPERSLNIDLDEVESVDASGLGLLVELQDWARRENRTLKFQNASDFVGRLIALTRLNEVLRIPSVPLPHRNDDRGFASAALSA
jgi:anti-anti-sigma factor